MYSAAYSRRRHPLPTFRTHEAKRVCPDELRGVPGAALDLNQLKSCYMNVCFGSNEHIFQQAKSLGL